MNTTKDNIYTILHVDDDPSCLSQLRRCLRKEPCQLISVQTAAEALKIAKAVYLDLAILDVSMPDLSGFRLLNRLRAIHPQVPALMLTGSQDDKTLYQAVEDHCNGFFEKTCDNEWLLQNIQRVITQQQYNMKKQIRKHLTLAHKGE